MLPLHFPGVEVKVASVVVVGPQTKCGVGVSTERANAEVSASSAERWPGAARNLTYLAGELREASLR